MKLMKYDPESGYISYVENEELNRVARVCEEINPEWQHEHGQLLAAAPALLAALRSFGGDGGGFCSCPLDNPQAPDEAHSTQCQMARNAIAAATGQLTSSDKQHGDCPCERAGENEHRPECLYHPNTK